MKQMLAAWITIGLGAVAWAQDKPPIDWEKGGGEIKADQLLDGPAKAKPSSGLPRVLLIGDSISIGYTAAVKAYLKDKAEVVHPPGNCQDSGTGVKNLKAWLGSGKWDVIHFNFGIWDTHYLAKASGTLIRDETKVTLDDVRIRATPDQYRDNLQKIVEILQGTGARVLFANTTPVMYRKGARFDDVPTYNEVAATVMKERGIELVDLYAISLPVVEKWQGPDRVHFNATGNTGLGETVGKTILMALEQAKAGKDAKAAATQPAK